MEYVIRAKNNRPVKDGGKLFEAINDWDVAHTYEIDVPATDKRSAHSAKLQLKFGLVEIKKSEGKSVKKQPPFLKTWVLEAKELPDSVVGNEQPIDWVLLTSHPIESIEMALQIIQWYKQRWNIEQVFRTLKNKGFRFESSQLSNYEKLQKIMVLALVGAMKVLQLVRARDGDTQQTIQTTFNLEEEKFLLVLNKQVEGKTVKQQNPYSPNSLAFAAWTIARLSGWSGYKSQRPPGPIDFLTGMERFYERLEGYKLNLS